MHNTGISVLIQTYLVGLVFIFVPFAITMNSILYKVDTALCTDHSVYDLWNVTDPGFRSAASLSVLRKNDWISDSVSDEEFDYIFTMIEQLQPFVAPDVPIEMVLAVISVESSYMQDLVGFSDDSGLMQIIPRFHRERIAQYLYDENIDIFDIRVNLATGMDYLSELTEFSSGDDALTLMAYNEGPLKARQRRERGIVSSYAEIVMERMKTIKEAMDGRYGSWENVDRQQKPLREESSN